MTNRVSSTMTMVSFFLSLLFFSVTVEAGKHRPNLLFIMVDQQRFDALRRAQDDMKDYDDKLKIETPNLDRLAASGVYFRHAYCGVPSCAPARAILRTGNTMERTGVQVNKMEEIIKLKMFRKKVNRLRTYDRLLVENRGYVAETYGKWHLPLKLYQGITYNDYDFETSVLNMSYSIRYKRSYLKSLHYLTNVSGLTKTFKEGQQENPGTLFPYDPVLMDTRYGMPTNTTLLGGNGQVVGIDSLPTNFSKAAILAQTALRALDRLSAQQAKPFSLTVSFTSPHPPMVVAPEFYNHYHTNRSNLLLPKSLEDDMANSAYAGNQKKLNASEVREWTAVYYALVTEIDDWIGKILDKLEDLDIRNNTMIVYTSDHGEMLGAHSMEGKSIFLEEATRVPLLMSFPGRIALNTTVREPVGHLDVFSTVLDYLGATELDKSDGTSLRRYIEKTNYNEVYDNEIVVAERDARLPKNGTLAGRIGNEPNFMIRKGNHKLMMPKRENSLVLDMMYDLGSDPYERNNLLGTKGLNASDSVVGKAEHLRILLLEWMAIHDGKKGHYSNNKYNAGEGKGDIGEIRKRQTWKTLDYWQSDETLMFGEPVLVIDESRTHHPTTSSFYIRNEYLYIGRTNPGVLRIKKISVTGPDADFFELNVRKARIKQGEHVRVRVQFRSRTPVSISSLDAKINIVVIGDGVHTVEIKGVS